MMPAEPVNRFETKAAARLWAKTQSLNNAVLSGQAGGFLDQTMAEAALRIKQPIKNIHWLAYQPIKGEINLAVSISEKLELGDIQSGQLWLPKVQGQHLIAGQWGRTIPGAYGIAEPVDNLTDDWMSLNPLVLFIPCMAISPDGFRLGHGKGYYDRLLSQLTQQGIEYISIGVCPQALGAQWPTDPWDIALHGHLSETGIRWV